MHSDHQNEAWLRRLPIDPDGAFGDPSELKLPDCRAFRTRKRWSYDRATETAALATKTEQTDSTGVVLDSATRGPVRMHCFFRYEMEYLLERAGFEVEALYGDFSRDSLTRDSTEMIWVASRRSRSAIRDRRTPAGD